MCESLCVCVSVSLCVYVSLCVCGLMCACVCGGSCVCVCVCVVYGSKKPWLSLSSVGVQWAELGHLGTAVKEASL